MPARRTRPATPHRTAEKRWRDPTPTIALAIVCVVLTGIPLTAPRKDERAPGLRGEAAHGRSLLILFLIVFTIRQPPLSVPMAMAACAARITHRGMVNSDR